MLCYFPIAAVTNDQSIEITQIHLAVMELQNLKWVLLLPFGH